ncbi:hypothetical protein POVWA2_014020 [Plasmodium ovale wallikeri]|uniref:Uncharacterized protein n=1 Tax=Plasmodium ovale wallikeri TaxID=864142 RepID=A0A1A8YN85_PLAOA|nr:hypothetical protein POVWA1_014170 [Plasmodium ovale wallikeri]SBT33296.1 hypothetical protein POVWA2_014020 [Plasmodium ovale wallikeri]
MSIARLSKGCTENVVRCKYIHSEENHMISGLLKNYIHQIFKSTTGFIRHISPPRMCCCVDIPPFECSPLGYPPFGFSPIRFSPFCPVSFVFPLFACAFLMYLRIFSSQWVYINSRFARHNSATANPRNKDREKQWTSL